MPAELALVDPPAELYRVERTIPPLRFSRIDAVDAALDRAGNRFDVPGAAVLYGASSREGALAETLARFRPSARLAQLLAQSGADRLPPLGLVPASWRTRRRMRRFTTLDPLPFVDIESPRSHSYLTRNAASVLTPLGLDSLDVAAVRGPRRLLTRGLASWLYAQTDPHGNPRYGGIRYVSRLGDFECWAVFDGTAVALLSEERLAADDPALLAVASIFELVVR